MTTVVKIDGVAIDFAEFSRFLKLTGQFDALLERFVRDRLTALGARRAGFNVSTAEIQERADEFRRQHGLHRASDTNKYLDALRISLEEFEAFITDSVYQEKVMSAVCSDQAVEAYFKLNSPKFDSIDVSHIVLDSESKAKEMLAVLLEEPDGFEQMAREHSLADTRQAGGRIGKLRRGSLRPEIEAKAFNAVAGELLGPFASPDRSSFEVLRIDARHAAHLDAETCTEVRRLLREEWLRARVQEHVIALG